MRIISSVELDLVAGGGDYSCDASDQPEDPAVEASSSGSGSTVPGPTTTQTVIVTAPAPAPAPVVGVVNPSDCKTDTATGTGIGAVVGAGASLGNPVVAALGATAGLYVALRLSSGCQPRRNIP